MSHYREIILALSTLLLCVWFSLASGSAIAQLQYDPELGEARMSGVVEVEGVSKDELHKRARQWMAQKFKSSDGNVMHEDASKGILVGTNNLLLQNRSRLTILIMDRVINHKLSLELKDGKYRYTINNAIYSYTNWDPVNNQGRTFNEAMDESYRRLHDKEEKRSVKGKKEKDKPKDLADVDEALIALINNLNKAMAGGPEDGADDW